MTEVVVLDSINCRRPDAGWPLALQAARSCTAAMLIEERVRAEYDRVRLGHGASLLYNELRRGEDARVDALAARALQAFTRGKLLLIVNDVQVTEPDAPIDLSGRVEAMFVRLTPLQGG